MFYLVLFTISYRWPSLLLCYLLKISTQRNTQHFVNCLVISIEILAALWQCLKDIYQWWQKELVTVILMEHFQSRTLVSNRLTHAAVSKVLVISSIKKKMYIVLFENQTSKNTHKFLHTAHEIALFLVILSVWPFYYTIHATKYYNNTSSLR